MNSDLNRAPRTRAGIACLTATINGVEDLVLEHVGRRCLLEGTGRILTERNPDVGAAIWVEDGGRAGAGGSDGLGVG